MGNVNYANFFSLWYLIQSFDLFGTTAFAVTGVLKAVEHRLDIFGGDIFSCYYWVSWREYPRCDTGKNSSNWHFRTLLCKYCNYYCNSCLLLYPKIKDQLKLFLTFDAVGLGVFTIIAATIALNMFGFNVLLMVFAGMITAISGVLFVMR